MSVALLRVVTPNSEVSARFGFFDSAREENRVLDSSRVLSRDKSVPCINRTKKGGRQRWNCNSFNGDSFYSSLASKGLDQGRNFSVLSSFVAAPAGDMALTSEQKVYDVVLKQAALVKRHLKTGEDVEVKPDILLPGSLGLLSEAYDRCREVCAEYAKTFYLGTLLMTPARRKAIWAIYGENPCSVIEELSSFTKTSRNPV